MPSLAGEEAAEKKTFGNAGMEAAWLIIALLASFSERMDPMISLRLQVSEGIIGTRQALIVSITPNGFEYRALSITIALTGMKKILLTRGCDGRPG